MPSAKGSGAAALALALLAGGLVAGLGSLGCGAEARPEAVIDLGPGEGARVVALPPAATDRVARGPIAWSLDVVSARAKARRDERPLLILAVAEWSVASAELERGPLAVPKVVQAVRRAVALRLDLTDADATGDLAESYRVASVPTLIVLGPEGEERFRSAGPDLDLDALVSALEE